MIVEKSSKPDKTVYKCDRCGKTLNPKERVGYFRTSGKRRTNIIKYMDLCIKCANSLHYGVFKKSHLKNQECK